MILKIFYFCNNLFFNTIIKLKSLKDLFRLRRRKEDAIKALTKSLISVMHNEFLPEEKIWIDKIEILRDVLSKSTNKISITDYGTGSPDLKLSCEEMRQGRVVNRTIGEVCKTASMSYKWAFLLFKLIREFRPNIVIEMGSSLGISGTYQAAALKLNRQGKMVTLEGAESLASLAKENFKKLDLENIDVVVGRFSDTLQDVLLKNSPVDFIFIDGHHDKDATVRYYNQVLPYLSDRAIIVFDDIGWSVGMQQAWEAIKISENVKVVLDLHDIGICISQRMAVPIKKKYYYKIEI